MSVPSTVTTTDFRAKFFRGFPYLPVFDDAALYNNGSIVYYDATKLFYSCIANGTTGVLPTETASWAAYSDDILNYIQDADITNAFSEATAVFNEGLYPDTDTATDAYLQLSAHFLVTNVLGAQAGISMGGSGLVNSKSAGSVSESYSIPEKWLKSDLLYPYTQTSYGIKYLTITRPYMVGGAQAMYRQANP